MRSMVTSSTARVAIEEKDADDDARGDVYANVDVDADKRTYSDTALTATATTTAGELHRADTDRPKLPARGRIMGSRVESS